MKVYEDVSVGSQFGFAGVSKGGVVQTDGVLDDLVGLLPALELQHLHLLVLQLLVVLEEAVDLVEQVLGEFADVGVVRDGHVVLGDGDDLVVLLALVDHAHHPDDLGLDEAERLHAHAAEHQDVEGVLVVAVGLRDEPVVGGVVHCAEQHAVQLQQSAVLVQLVFHLALSRDLDYRVYDLGGVLAVGYEVPRVFGEVFLAHLNNSI